jgi:hypothetical protein
MGLLIDGAVGTDLPANPCVSGGSEQVVVIDWNRSGGQQEGSKPAPPTKFFNGLRQSPPSDFVNGP